MTTTSPPQKYVEHAVAFEGISPDVPLYKVIEGNEPCFFRTYFSWDSTRSVVTLNITSVFQNLTCASNSALFINDMYKIADILKVLPFHLRVTSTCISIKLSHVLFEEKKLSDVNS